MTSVQVRDPDTYAIIGAAMAVHAELGCGFLEVVYQQALNRELAFRRVPSRREVELPVFYRGQRLDCFYKADFICDESVIVEVKALREIGSVERSQVLNYLKATGYHRALLINFGAESVQFERIVR